MNYQQTFKIGLKQGCLFYALSTLLLAIQFGSYIIGSTVLDFMDFEGWVFFIASSVSHASQFALIPYLLGTIVLACRCHKSAMAVQIVGVILLCILNYLNSQVYGIYHFHINGFVLSMVFGEGAGEIFNFSILLYLKEIAPLFDCGSNRGKRMVCIPSHLAVEKEGIRLVRGRLLHRMHPLCPYLAHLRQFLSAPIGDEERHIAALLLPYIRQPLLTGAWI